jgi:hypothetical protein
MMPEVIAGMTAQTIAEAAGSMMRRMTAFAIRLMTVQAMVETTVAMMV